MNRALLCFVVAISFACENEVLGPTTEREREQGPPPVVTPPEEPRDPPAPPGGQCVEGTNKLIPANAGAVYYGTRQPSHVPLDAAQIMAVVGIGYGNPAGASCSGTLIADRVILTAKHCTEGESAGSMFALFGIDDESPVLAIRAVQKREHPDHDMAMLELESAPADQLNVRPIFIDRGDLNSGDVGETFEQSGFGQTENGYSDGRFFVAEVLDGFENNGRELVVNGQGQHGVCFGDSGGPSMRVTGEGVRVAGALSWGDPSCVGRDRYSRVDYDRDWIEEWTGPTPGTDVVNPCGTITETGRCDGAIASRCEAGQLVSETCSGGLTCGFDDGVGGYGCLEPANDPCGGVGLFGNCEGNTLAWCNQGQLLERNCGACGESCGLVDNSFGFACLDEGFVPSPSLPTDGDACGDIDYTGVCDGATAIWCDDDTGVIETRDCANQGQTCGFVNGNIGNFCMDEAPADPCDGLDYRGECQGDVARWCQNGELRSENCASQGNTCGFVNDDVGFYCN